jgi:hypothetical protein
MDPSDFKIKVQLLVTLICFNGHSLWNVIELRIIGLLVFGHVCKVSKSSSFLRHVRPFVHPHGTARLRLKGLS